MSDSPNFASAFASSDSTLSASAAFFSCRARIFSSMLPAHTSLNTNTGLSWPMRWARSVAWFSAAGFHHGS